MIPALFIGHGAPGLVLEDNEYTELLKGYGKTIPTPKAIVIFSAHYESDIQLIGASSSYDMIYDFHGFPRELYDIKYNAGSNVAMAERVQLLLEKHNIASKLDYTRGIDHGAWTILKLMYPKADIPVITMSVNPRLSSEEQYNIGNALELLKAEDVLIIASGGIVHNLSTVRFKAGDRVDEWAISFNEWIKMRVEHWDLEELFNYETQAPYAKVAVPRNEHFINLLIAMGAGHSSREAKLVKCIYQLGNLSLDFFSFK